MNPKTYNTAFLGSCVLKIHLKTKRWPNFFSFPFLTSIEKKNISERDKSLWLLPKIDLTNSFRKTRATRLSPWLFYHAMRTSQMITDSHYHAACHTPLLTISWEPYHRQWQLNCALDTSNDRDQRLPFLFYAAAVTRRKYPNIFIVEINSYKHIVESFNTFDSTRGSRGIINFVVFL